MAGGGSGRFRVCVVVLLNFRPPALPPALVARVAGEGVGRLALVARLAAGGTGRLVLVERLAAGGTGRLALVERLAAGGSGRGAPVEPLVLLAFTLRPPVTAGRFLTFATCAPRLRNGRRFVSGYIRYRNLGKPATYVNGSDAGCCVG